MKKLALLLALLGLATPASAQNPFSLINFGSTAVDTNSGNKSAGTLRVVLATDGTNPTTVFKIDLSGTSANATAIKVDGSAVTQPVSVASLPLPSGAATAAKQPALGTAGTASSDVITVQGIAGMTKLLVTPDSVALPANQSVNISQINSVTPLMGNGAAGTGGLRVSIANDSTGVVQPGNTANTTPWLVQTVPGTANGLTTFVLEAAASDNHTNVKNGAGVVYHVTSFNNSATINYYRLYNAATGFNGCNSATNLLWEGLIPASTSGGGFVEDISVGITFSTGISICITGAFGNTNTTNATASAILFNLGYK